MNFFLKEIKIHIILFLSIFFIYFFTINQCFTIVIDSSTYIANVFKNDPAYHPHHLLYHSIFLYWGHFLESIGFKNMVINIASINVIFSSLSSVIIYLIFKN